MMHAYFFGLGIILETEIRSHPMLITAGIINDLERENNQ